MNYAWQTYQEKLSTNNSAFSPFELEDNYVSTRTKYTSTKSKQFVNKNKQVEGVLFLAETLKEEVLQGTEKQQKKKLKQLRKLLIQFTTIALMVGVGTGFEMITLQPHTVEASNLMTTTANSTPAPEITPDSIMDWALKIALMVVAIGVGLSMSMFAIVGIYLMITRKRKESIEWNSDILRGVVQCLVSIPLIYSLFQLAQMVFKNLPFLQGLM
ncbi:hypothetical protein M3649_04355 [Ureibacillus chungkukjangi]|uniref:hypothetical protein n=1 Tax=Ureibacillus chungkukjangi TaxID=1202712 RepID=UPI00203B2102|nr:hypothetical protein [Ureibacillus chungkukjangi]MCM3387366.1 hypothetical protein [Ureibacillus chungkukjangi]